jgi:hypothetical protein
VLSTTTWSSAEGTGAGDAVATAGAAAAAVSSCYGPVATTVLCDGSPAAAVLTSVSGTLSEHRLVVTGAPDLSALAGARAGTIGVTLRAKQHEDEHLPLKIEGAQGKCYSPQVRKALLPLPRGFGGVAVAPAGASTALAGSSTENLVAGTYAPATGADSTAASAASGDRGGGFHLSGGARPPLLSSSSSSDDDPSGVPGGESPCCSRSRYSSLYCSRRSCRQSLLSFACVARSCSRHCTARAVDRARGVGGSDRAACMVTLCCRKLSVPTSTRCENLKRGGDHLPSGSITNDQRSSWLCGTNLRLTARLALVASYSGSRRSYSSRERVNDVGWPRRSSRIFGAPTP